MNKSYFRAALSIFVLASVGLFIQVSRAELLPPQGINTNFATDLKSESLPVVEAGLNQTWIAVWVGLSSNPLDSRGSDPSTGGNYNEDLYYARSTDNGRTWNAPALLKTNWASDQFDDIEPDIATDGAGNWIVVWRSKDPLGGTVGFDTDVLMTISNDNGLTWSPPKALDLNASTDPGGYNSSSAGCQDDYPTICCDRKGHWMVTWTRFDNRSGGVWQTSELVSVSADNGATWSVPAVLQTRSESQMYSTEPPKVATDFNDRWIVVWSSRINSSSDFDTYYSISPNNGASWGPAALLNSNGASDSGKDILVDIAADGQGHWMAVWMSDDSLGNSIGTDYDILYTISPDNGQTWTAPAPVNNYAYNDTGNDVYPHLFYDGMGHWVVEWMTNIYGGDLDLCYSMAQWGGQWADAQPLNAWALSDHSFDGGGGRAVYLGGDQKGTWMAVWASDYDFATQTSMDFDIMGVIYSPEHMHPRAQAATLDSITWQWTPYPGANGYKIWADQGESTPTTYRTIVAAETTSWTMTGLSANAPYTCRISALTSGGEVPGSTFGQAWTLIEPVTGLNIGAVTPNSIEFSPANTNFTNLALGASGLAESNFTANADSGWRHAVAPWTSTGLTPNTTYHLAAATRNGGGVPTVPAVAFQVTLAAPPQQGRNVAFTRGGNGYGVGTPFFFQNMAGFGPGTHGGSPYKVSAFRWAFDTNPTHVFTGTEMLWNTEGLTQIPTEGGAYYLHLQSQNSQGAATPQTLDLGPLVIDVTPPGQPGTPQGPGPVVFTSSVTFSWAPATDPESGVDAYQIQIGTTPGASDYYNNTLNTLSKTVTIPAGKTLYCRVRARNLASLFGPWSEVSAGVFRDTLPSAPQVGIDPVTPRTLDDIAAVTTSTDADPGDGVVAYRYEWRLGGALQSTSATLPNDLTVKNQNWTLTAWAQDSYGGWSTPSTMSFSIANSPPTQPIVEIVPKPAQAGQDLIVDIQVYSVDPDGDPVAYDFQWFKSTDGGTTWVHKVELDGTSQVSGQYIHDGELWEVRYTPYEKVLAKLGKTAAKPLGRVEGAYGWDRVFIGANNPPKLSLELPVVQKQAGGTLMCVSWIASDGDGDALTLDLEWTNTAQTQYHPLIKGLAPGLGTYQAILPVPVDKPITIHGVIRDAKGAVVQALSAPAVVLPAEAGLIVDYLLGRTMDGSGLDSNDDLTVDAADIVASVVCTPPAAPAQPSPADGARGVSLTPALDWANNARATGYQVYLWKANTARPGTPKATVASSGYAVTTALAKNTTYWWQVVAVGNAVKISGPVWSFTTRP